MKNPLKQYESENTKQTKVKLNKTKETEMKTTKSTVKTVFKYVVTVAVTLGVVYAGYSLYMQGYNQGKVDQRSIAKEVTRQVADLKTSQK